MSILVNLRQLAGVRCSFGAGLRIRRLVVCREHFCNPYRFDTQNWRTRRFADVGVPLQRRRLPEKGAEASFQIAGAGEY